MKREEDIALIAVKLANAIAEPYEVPGPTGPTMVSVTASIGIALYPRDGPTPDELISRADAAMYVAKRSGAVHAFSPAEAPVAKP